MSVTMATLVTAGSLTGRFYTASWSLPVATIHTAQATVREDTYVTTVHQTRVKSEHMFILIWIEKCLGFILIVTLLSYCKH